MKKSVKKVEHCPLCDASLNSFALCEVKKTGNMRLQYITCASCHSSLLQIDVEQESICTSIRMLTDLNKKDVDRFWNNTHIQENDILDIHELIQQPMSMQHLLYYKD